MVLHLEYSEQCDSQRDEEYIKETAWQCYASKKYRNFGDYSDYYSFKCPCCDVVFHRMSGLLQHAESERCEVGMEPTSPLGRFLRFLRHRLG